MSLKKLVIGLLVINLGYFAFSQGWLQALMGGDTGQREPERIAKQINPDAIAVQPTSVLTKPAISKPKIAVDSCLQDREQWMIYMGPFANTALAEKKKAELKKIGVTSKDVSKPALPIGLTVGQFDSEAAAREEFKRLGARGVRTATVMLWDKGTVPCPSTEKP